MQHDYIKLLIKSAQQGKKNSYRELCNINLKRIYNLAVRFLLNTKIAEEITQNIFIEAWENLKFLRPEQSFDIWLKSIAIYKVLDELRTNKIKERLISEEIISDDNFKVECNRKFENLILTLPEKERIAFILHDIEKYTYAEVSDFMHEYSEEEIKTLVRETRNSIINSPDYDQ
jgi:RNA polymerase sigma-70 factor (ECF subfamily)